MSSSSTSLGSGDATPANQTKIAGESATPAPPHKEKKPNEAQNTSSTSTLNETAKEQAGTSQVTPAPTTTTIATNNKTAVNTNVVVRMSNPSVEVTPITRNADKKKKTPKPTKVMRKPRSSFTHTVKVTRKPRTTLSRTSRNRRGVMLRELTIEEVVVITVLKVLAGQEGLYYFPGTFDDLSDIVRKVCVQFSLAADFRKSLVQTCLSVLTNVGVLEHCAPRTEQTFVEDQKEDLEQKAESTPAAPNTAPTATHATESTATNKKRSARVPKGFSPNKSLDLPFMQVLQVGREKVGKFVVECLNANRPVMRDVSEQLAMVPTQGQAWESFDTNIADLKTQIELRDRLLQQEKDLLCELLGDQLVQGNNSKKKEKTIVIDPPFAYNTKEFLPAMINLMPSDIEAALKEKASSSRGSSSNAARPSFTANLTLDQPAVSRSSLDSESRRINVYKARRALTAEGVVGLERLQSNDKRNKTSTGIQDVKILSSRTVKIGPVKPVRPIDPPTSNGMTPIVTKPILFADIVDQFRLCSVDSGGSGGLGMVVVNPSTGDTAAPVTDGKRTRKRRKNNTAGTVTSTEVDLPSWSVHDWTADKSSEQKQCDPSEFSDEVYLERHNAALKEAKDRWEKHIREKRRLRQEEKEKRLLMLQQRARTPKVVRRTISRVVSAGSKQEQLQQDQTTAPTGDIVGDDTGPKRRKRSPLPVSTRNSKRRVSDDKDTARIRRSTRKSPASLSGKKTRSPPSKGTRSSPLKTNLKSAAPKSMSFEGDTARRASARKRRRDEFEDRTDGGAPATTVRSARSEAAMKAWAERRRKLAARSMSASSSISTSSTYSTMSSRGGKAPVPSSRKVNTNRSIAAKNAWAKRREENARLGRKNSRRGK